ncbi:hypothetical protein QNI19_36405 [Cytophagaceae bacterium DM2B3-1]|uniref:Lanthionine synthetase n=1 Tax=Xanthocytophaga flava TaxID=3048013 RepID=A0ABT7CXL3_9BACT|nr:lanthionine synthetase LanC family protein [Xanthocytophaga flavus]MDJ1498475.1 hypothetical protein [Xanthocytophaga flavus]
MQAPLVERMASELTSLSLIPDSDLSTADTWLWHIWQQELELDLLQDIIHTEDWRPASQLIPLLTGCQTLYQYQLHKKETIRKTLLDFELQLYQEVMQRIQEQKLGYCQGSTAILHYFLSNQTSTPHIKEMQHRLLSQLCRHWLPIGSEPVTDLTLESGYAGYILLLVRLLMKSQASPDLTQHQGTLMKIIDQYIYYLYAHQLDVNTMQNQNALFPVQVSDSEWATSDTLSWSAGDLIQILVLYEVGQLQKRKELIKWADRLAGFIISQRMHMQKQSDSLCMGLTDGIAGLVLFYRHLHSLTQQERFFKEGSFWLGELWQRYIREQSNEDNSLLTGNLGVYAAIRQWTMGNLNTSLLFL